MKYTLAVVALVLLVGCSGASPTAPTSVPTAVVVTPPPVVVPSITGEWVGAYTVTNCTESGGASGFCQGFHGGGLLFTPHQSGSTLSGTLSIGGYTPIAVAGTVGTDQQVALQGSGGIQFNATLALNAFRGSLAGNTLTGTLGFTITVANVPGSVSVVAGFTLTR